MNARKWSEELSDYIGLSFIDLNNNECGGLPYDIQECQEEICFKTIDNIEFTFQKDIDDVPVFSGDILLTNECDCVGYVVWNYCGFVVVDGRGGFSDVDYSKCKVLGNIKQNTELIEKYKLIIK